MTENQRTRVQHARSEGDDDPGSSCARNAVEPSARAQGRCTRAMCGPIRRGSRDDGWALVWAWAVPELTRRARWRWVLRMGCGRLHAMLAGTRCGGGHPGRWLEALGVPGSALQPAPCPEPPRGCGQPRGHPETTSRAPGSGCGSATDARSMTENHRTGVQHARSRGDDDPGSSCARNAVEPCA